MFLRCDQSMGGFAPVANSTPQAPSAWSWMKGVAYHALKRRWAWHNVQSDLSISKALTRWTYSVGGSHSGPQGIVHSGFRGQWIALHLVHQSSTSRFSNLRTIEDLRLRIQSVVPPSRCSVIFIGIITIIVIIGSRSKTRGRHMRDCRLRAAN